MADYNSLYQQSLYLSPEQQDLLLAALSSNNPPQKQGTNNPSMGDHHKTESSHNTTNNNSPLQPQANNFDLTSSTYFESPAQDAPGSGHLGFGSDESPFLDFDPDADFDFAGADQLIGEIPEIPAQADAQESAEQRKISDGEKEGKKEETETGKKRRESEDKEKATEKAAKKPGRKPLTSEPTSKRKAQNRAAQRAFRERKEKHLRDLENKVQELQKASEAANQENTQLRLQVERLQVELREYRKRLSWLSSGNGFSTMSALHNVNSRNLSGLNNNEFYFDFPKFGDLPGNHMFSNGSLAKSVQNNKPNGTSSTAGSAPLSNIPGVLSRGSVSSVGTSGQPSPGQNNSSGDKAAVNGLPNGLPNVTQGGKDAASNGSSSKAGSGSNAPSSQTSTGTGANSTSNSRSQMPGSSAASNSDSPSACSESQQGQASSMGTSPEPSQNSPSVSKPNDSGAENSGDRGKVKKCTIDGEKSFCEQLSLACGNINDPVPAVLKQSNNDNSRMPGQSQNAPNQPLSFDWLAQQNGGNFDPVLFNDYREPQEAVLSQDFGTFFNDAFPLPDLGSPFHNFNDVASPPAPSKDLVGELDKVDDDDEEEVVPGEDKSQMMTCTKIWDRLQSMEKFRNGEIDVDSLCTELRTKARCSEGGVVVNKKDVDDIMGRVQ